MISKKRGKTERNLAPRISRILVIAGMFFVMFAILSAAVTPERYDIQVGSPAPNTIKATKDVEDELTTEKLKTEAANAVRSVYYVDDSVEDAVLGLLSEKFAAMGQVSLLSLPQDDPDDVTDSQLSSANALLSPVEITADQLRALSAADENTVNRVFDRASDLVRTAMQDNLRETQISACLDHVLSELVDDGYDPDLAAAVTSAVGSCVRPNYFYDEQATEAARAAERAKIETVVRIKGEVIVSDGEIVTEAQYRMLDSLGIIKESSIDVTLYYGVALLVALLIGAVVAQMSLFAPRSKLDLRSTLLVSLICLIEVGACLLAREINPYLMPSALGVLLLSQLVSRRVSIFLNMALGVIVSLFASASSGFFNMAMFTIFVNAMVSGTVALIVLRKKQQRTTNLLAGLAIGLTNMVCTFAVGLINNANLKTVLGMAEWAGISGILASFLCIAFIPLLEWMFNLVTPSKLIELSNPNQPLLRRLLLEAPGTYHHSIIVANLAEAAAGEIGANALLARVGAYYHDVGKLKRPSYFKENQMGDNPHDRTDPRVSTAIITAHPRDGVQLARAERMPEPILDIIRSHHGDTPVLYFYNKSVKENGDSNVDDFRYEGPRPNSREAAIVMLADTVEAAVRSMPNPDAESMNALIRKLVKQKLDDGQLDQSDLTLKNIDVICASFFTILSGVFHERIEYPSIEIPRKQPQTAIQKEETAK